MATYDSKYPPARQSEPLLTSLSPEGRLKVVKRRLSSDGDSVSIVCSTAGTLSISLSENLGGSAYCDFQVDPDGTGTFSGVAILDTLTGAMPSVFVAGGEEFLGTIPVGFSVFRVTLNAWVSGGVDVVLTLYPIASTVYTMSRPVRNNSAAAPTSVIVGAASALVVSAHTNRMGLVLRNISTGGQRVSFNLGGNPAVLDTGITLYAYDSYSMNDFEFSTRAVYAIASAGGAVIAVQEFVS